MGKVADATRKVVSKYPCILECMSKGIVDFTALARFLKPEIEKECGKANIDAVRMALLRYAQKMEEIRSRSEEFVRLVGRCVLSLKNDVVVCRVSQADFARTYEEILKKTKKARFFQLIQDTSGFTIIVDSAVVSPELERQGFVIRHRDQSAIVITSPEELEKIHGVIAYFTQLLAEKGINITEMSSSYVDTIFVVSRKDALLAYKTLEEKIHEYK
ncbi:MAG: ACT domain-containing protein [Candidatus Micrarchaeia archaeon]